MSVRPATGQKFGKQFEGGIMTVVGRFSASKVAFPEWASSAMESRCLAARPSSFSWVGLSFNLTAGCSSVFMTGIRGATPPPAG
jgi:hypothetical protein